MTWSSLPPTYPCVRWIRSVVDQGIGVAVVTEGQNPDGKYLCVSAALLNGEGFTCLVRAMDRWEWGGLIGTPGDVVPSQDGP